MEGKNKKSSLPAEEEASPAAILARPLSLLRHVAHGLAGYLGGLASRLKPAGAAAACQSRQEDGKIQPAAVMIEEEEMVVEVRSRAAPQRPRGLTEGSGGRHHK